MGKFLAHLRFLEEAMEQRGILREVVCQNFDGEGSGGWFVVAEIDSAHAAFTDPAKEAELSQGRQSPCLGWLTQ